MMINDEQTITQILTVIANRYGTNIFNDHKRFYAILCDMASGDHRMKERRRIKAALESGAVDILFKAQNDQESYELYVNEAITYFIEQSDIQESIAKDTIMSIVDALPFLTPNGMDDEQSETQLNPQKNDDDLSFEHKANYHKKTNKLLMYLMITTMIAILTLLVSLIVDVSFKQELIAIASGVLFTNMTLGIAYILQEYLIFNDMFETITIMLPILFVINLIFKIIYGNEIFFGAFFVFIWIGAILNTIYTYIEVEYDWMKMNLFFVIGISVVFVMIFVNISWTIWQWIIGIAGGILLAAVVFAIIEILDVVGVEKYITFTILLILMTVGNAYCLFANLDIYLIIGTCFVVFLTIGNLIALEMSFNEVSLSFQILNIIMIIMNGGLLYILVTTWLLPMFH